MNVHEYQAKKLLERYGIAVPRGMIADSPEAARDAAGELMDGPWVVKAQVHSGGRGHAGGVAMAADPDAVAAEARRMLGSRLVTHQHGEGLLVERVLIEQATAIERELYLSVLIDRDAGRRCTLASATGGVDIEAIAADSPEAIVRCAIHPAAGLRPWQTRRIGFALGLNGAQRGQLASLVAALYRLAVEKDAEWAEINPLVVTADGALIALDAKLNIDDNALFRQEEIAGLRDLSQEEPRESLARSQKLSFVGLDGTIGCMVNGAGLAMATMDLIEYHGGAPANFLDVGGGTTAERVAEAFKLIVADGRVTAILVNIFGGIVRCDMIAEGIVQALREVEVRVPVVVRLEGTNAERGRRLLASTDLAIITASNLDEAAARAVAAGGASA